MITLMRQNTAQSAESRTTSMSTKLELSTAAQLKEFVKTRVNIVQNNKFKNLRQIGYYFNHD